MPVNKGAILVTGATGAIGPVVVRCLSEAGYGVHTLSLDHFQPASLHTGVKSFVGDITDPSAVMAAIRGVDAVIHMAALLHIVNPPLSMREKYEQVNVGGTENVVRAAVENGVRRVVLFSTIAVYGQADGRMLDERSNARPDTMYAETKYAAERVVLNVPCPGGGALGTVLRLGAVYGHRIKGNYQRLVHGLNRGMFVPVGSGHNRRTLVHEEDVARAAVLAVSHPAAAGKVYNVTDGSVHTLKEIIESICVALGRKPPRLALPVGPVRSLAGLMEQGCRLIGMNPPVTRDMIDKYTEDSAVDGGLIQKELGFTPRYDLKTGWHETIKAMRDIGAIH